MAEASTAPSSSSSTTNGRVVRLFNVAMRMKFFVVDIATIYLWVRIWLNALLPESFALQHWLVTFWIWVMVGGFTLIREIGRWEGQHRVHEYKVRMLAHGEIYLFAFWAMVFGVEFCKSFLEFDQARHEIVIEVGWKITLIYIFTWMSKAAKARFDQFRFSDLLEFLAAKIR